MNSHKPMFFVILIVMTLGICISAQARPPKPGKLFVWVAPHQNTANVLIPGHWKYTGPGVKGKAWIKGHYHNGTWVSGHWIAIAAPGKDAIWVARHKGTAGYWIPGHWKYTGPEAKGMVWVAGHFNNAGIWVPGYFGKIKGTPPNPHRPNKVWIPKHRGPHGRWIPGHWK